MIGNRKTLAVSIATPGGDNPLLLNLLQAAPIYRGVALTPGQLKLVAKGGTAPYAYQILSTSSNDLPPGLSIPNPLDGEIDGTATTAGHYTFIAEVQDADSNVFPHSFSVDVLAQLFWIGPPPPVGEIDVPYSYRFRVRDASGVELTSGFTFSGSLSTGFSLDTDGTLHAADPSAPAGITYFTVHATDGTDTLDIPVVLTVVEKVVGHFLEDRAPPSGWGGGPSSFLPEIVRLQKWEANLVITGGVPPYSVAMQPGGEFPSGIFYNPPVRKLQGVTSDAAEPFSKLCVLLITDALGSVNNVQRNLFVLDAIQGRITPQHNGSDVAGGDGPTKFNFVEGANVTITPTNDGDTVNFEISATGGGGGGSGIQTINGVGPDSSGDIEIGGIVEDSNGDLVVEFPPSGGVESVTGAVVDNTDPANPIVEIIGSLGFSVGREDGPILASGVSRAFLVPAKYADATNWKMKCKPAATVSVDIWYRAFSGTDPTVSDSIVGGNYPATSSSNNATGTTSGWTVTDFAQWGQIVFEIRANDFATFVDFLMDGTRTL